MTNIRGQLVWFLLTVLAGVAAFALWGRPAASRSFDEAALCVLAVAAFVVVVLPVFITRPFDLFHPLLLVGVSVFLGTTARTFFILFSESERVEWLLDGQPAGSLISGAAIILVAALCTVVGYFAAGTKRIPLERAALCDRQWSLPRLKLLVPLVILVAGVAIVDYLRQTGFEVETFSDLSSKRRVALQGEGFHVASLGYHKWAATKLLAPLYYMLLILYTQRRQGRAAILPWLIVTGLGAMVFPFLTSSRTSIILLVINTLVIGSLRRIVGWTHALFGVAAVVFVVVVMAGLRHGEMKDMGYVAGAVTHAGFVEDFLGNRNFTGITKTSHLYQKVPERMDYQWGRTMFLWCVAPVPRIFWPEKPVTSIGYEITERIYDRTIIRGGGTPPGLIGELILNFGVLSVPLAMCGYGVFLRLLYNSFRPVSAANRTLLLLYVTLLLPLSLLLMGGDVSRTMITLGRSLLTIVVYLWLVSFRLRASDYGLRAPVARIPEPGACSL